MPYLTLTEKSKATTKSWCGRLLQHPVRKGSGSILGHKTHKHILILFRRTHRRLCYGDYCTVFVGECSAVCNLFTSCMIRVLVLNCAL